MIKIAIAIQKGGSGKTTTVYNVAAELAAAGKRVLALDLDAQATLFVANWQHYSADIGP